MNGQGFFLNHQKNLECVLRCVFCPMKTRPFSFLYMQSQGDEINLRILFQSINLIILFVYQIQRHNHFDAMFEKTKKH